MCIIFFTNKSAFNYLKLLPAFMSQKHMPTYPLAIAVANLCVVHGDTDLICNVYDCLLLFF